MGLFGNKSNTSAPDDAAPPVVFTQADGLKLARDCYGEDNAAKLVASGCDERGFYCMLTFMADGGADGLYGADRVFPYSVWHAFGYIDRTGEHPVFKPLDINVMQAHSATLVADEPPMSHIAIKPSPRKSRPLGYSIEHPQEPIVPSGTELYNAEEAFFYGSALVAAGQLTKAWNHHVTAWWQTDERQFCLERLAEWKQALAQAEPQTDYARTLKRLAKIGVTVHEGDYIVCSNDHSLHRIGPDGINVERVGRNVIDDIDVDSKFSHEVGRLLSMFTSDADSIAAARGLLAERFGAGARIHLVHSDFSGTLEATAEARAERAAAHED